MQSFVPQKRKVKFELSLGIVDLNNVPLVSGTSFIKWHLPSSTAAEHRGKTSKCTIKDHKVNYEYEKTIPIRLVVGKDQMLQETWIHLEVLQEYQSGGRGERIALGLLKLNLAEYVETNTQSSGDAAGVGSGAGGGLAPGSGNGASITRRYLMQESKINSTIKISIGMKHLEGDRNYFAPPLRTAPVFGGIAGIMSQEASEVTDDVGHMPSLSSKSRETGELQDMYRSTLAASWAAQPGELKADECIEDIFAGGDGWGSQLHHTRDQTQTPTQSRSRLNVQQDRGGNSGDDDSGSRTTSSTNLAAMFSRKGKWSPKHKSEQHTPPHLHHHKHHSRGHEHHDEQRETPALRQGAISGRASLEQQVRKMDKASSSGRRRMVHEIDEFDNPYKEDLRSWKIGQSAAS